MPNSLSLKEFLETSSDAGKRVRTTTIILMVVTVLVFAGNLNSAQWAWSLNRLKARELVDAQLNKKIRDLETVLDCRKTNSNKDCPNPLDIHIDGPPSSCGVEVCGSSTWTDCESLDDERKNSCKLQHGLNCYKCAKSGSEDMIRNLRTSFVQNSVNVKVPFFGVSFDINDLGLLGGLSLIVVLIMLRLSLRNYIVSLRTGFKAAFKEEQEEEFYEILASRQLFVFPNLQDSNQKHYYGRTESFWRKLKGFFIKKQEGVGWSVNPQRGLRLVPKIISLVPSLVYLLVLINDRQSEDLGSTVHVFRTNLALSTNIIFLILIICLGFWCNSKWFEIEALWKIFNESVKQRKENSKNRENWYCDDPIKNKE